MNDIDTQCVFYSGNLLFSCFYLCQLIRALVILYDDIKTIKSSVSVPLKASTKETAVQVKRNLQRRAVVTLCRMLIQKQTGDTFHWVWGKKPQNNHSLPIAFLRPKWIFETLIKSQLI